ncbi:MAG: hypothetical protein AB9869_01085 [Verrucomicrobiia bacterium]
MLTLTCHFQFPDGPAALASITVEAPESRGEVEYAGDFHRLPNRFPRTQVSTLRLWARQVADQLGAQVQFSESGQYDTWAE